MCTKWIATFSVVLSAALGGCTRKQEVQIVNPKETYGMLRNDFAVLIDVREESEIADGMAEGAQWMPFTSKIEKNDPSWQQWAESLPKDKLIIVYCRSGRRSGEAAKRLAEKGLRVANMGAYEDWVKAGLPTKKPANE